MADRNRADSIVIMSDNAIRCRCLKMAITATKLNLDIERSQRRFKVRSDHDTSRIPGIT